MFNKKVLLSVGTIGLVFTALIIFVVAVNAQVWDQPQGKQAFGHTHEWSTLLSFPGDCPAGQFVSGVGVNLTCTTPAAVADNDWIISGNDMFSAVSGNVGIGGINSLSKLYVRSTLGFPNGAIRVEHSGANGMGIFINPIGNTGPSLWANGRGRFDGLVVGSVAGDNVGFNPGSGNLIVANNVGIGTIAPQSRLQVVNGYVQLALTSGIPPSVDCDEASEMGRMKVDDSGGGFLYICTITAAGIGWVAK